MSLIGFSTGALAYHDFAKGLEMVRRAHLRVVELSALREPELPLLVDALESLAEALKEMTYVSVHAPSAISPGEEPAVGGMLARIAKEHKWSIIVHPDVIEIPEVWMTLGESLCIENNDKRKSTGKRCDDLDIWFDRLPKAGFCLDLGHAKQVDRSMTEAYLMVKHHGHRLRQLHVSEVTTRSKHERLSALTVRSFREVTGFISDDVPVIIESPVPEADIAREVAIVRSALRPQETATGTEMGPEPTVGLEIPT